MNDKDKNQLKKIIIVSAKFRDLIQCLDCPFCAVRHTKTLGNTIKQKTEEKYYSAEKILKQYTIKK